MSISYASVAANPQGPKGESAEDSVNLSACVSGSPKLPPSTFQSPEPSSAPLDVGSAPGGATTSGDTPSEEFDLSVSASSSAHTPAPRAKKGLTPAPVPSKSVWGAANPVQASHVDEHKWPTPHQSSAIEQSQQSSIKSAATKAVKGSKWVPISAKFVLPSPRSSQTNGAGNQLKNKRKNKNNRKKSASAPSSAYDETKKDESTQNDDESIELEGKSASASQDTLEQLSNIADAASNGQQQQNPNDNRQRVGQQQKNFRRYNQNGTPQGNTNGRPQGQQQLQRQQGIYYQQFVPFQFQGNNRQFRPMNGGIAPYGRHNGNGNIQAGNHFFPNGFRPMDNGPFVSLPQYPQPMMVPGMPYGIAPVQIPPPISPKQNPEQALAQQIDYYFSLENLIKDIYLRRSMGTGGWIDLDLILNFKRVKIIVTGIRNAIEETDERVKDEKLDKSILTSLQQCQNLVIGYLNGKEANDAKATEVQLRVRHNFEQWILPDN